MFLGVYDMQATGNISGGYINILVRKIAESYHHVCFGVYERTIQKNRVPTFRSELAKSKHFLPHVFFIYVYVL